MTLLFPDPEIHLFDEFLSPQLCAELQQIAIRDAKPSTVIDKVTGKRRFDPNRNSYTVTYHPLSAETRDVTELLRQAFPFPVEHYEDFQLTYYETGGFYKAHHDAFLTHLSGSNHHLELGGQRIRTFLIYLNDVKEGGYTSFPNLGFGVLPAQGRLLCFKNLDQEKKPCVRAIHAADPVTFGRKFILTTWLREKPVS